MNINSAESLNLDSSQTVQTYLALFSSGLLGARLTVLKMLLRAEEKAILVSDAASVLLRALQQQNLGKGVRKSPRLLHTKL